jgi:hypothetical protein
MFPLEKLFYTVKNKPRVKSSFGSTPDLVTYSQPFIFFSEESMPLPFWLFSFYFSASVIDPSIMLMITLK